MTLSRDNLVVVCHQIRLPDNLGAIGRLMANFGFGELVLSEPQLLDFSGAERLAVKSTHILEGKRVVPDLTEALKDVVWACGTTMRSDLKRRTSSSPEEAIQRLAEHARRGKVALVFGGERRGLSDEDLAHCQDALVIPTREEQPSMNLAQSAAVLLYLCSRELSPPPEKAPAEEGAKLGAVDALQRLMREVLLDVEFLNAQAPEHVLHELTHSLARQGLTQREVELWLGAFKQVRYALKKPR